MSKPQVTITLGRTGQKVVKRLDGVRTDSHRFSGRKRSIGERFESNADKSMLSINKRVRGNASARSIGYDRVEGARVGKNDLRLKLIRKRLSRQKEHEVEERKKTELRQKMSRTVRSRERQEHSLLRHISPSKRDDGLLMMDPLRSYTRRISPPRYIDEVHKEPSTRPIASKSGRLLGRDVSYPSRPNGPAAMTMKGTLNAEKPVREPLPSSGAVPRNLYLGEQPLTVSSLLHSLGLGKYVVQFQAEEVDMTILRQMGDNDLKELGIPMGPRKKILLAILPRPKRQLL